MTERIQKTTRFTADEMALLKAALPIVQGEMVGQRVTLAALIRILACEGAARRVETMREGAKGRGDEG